MEKYISVSEMMELLGISRSAAYNLIKIPGFPVSRIGARVIIRESALHEWLARGGTDQQGA